MTEAERPQSLLDVLGVPTDEQARSIVAAWVRGSASTTAAPASGRDTPAAGPAPAA